MNLPNLQLPATPDEALAALKTLAAHSAHLNFTIAGQKHDAISFEGTEAISNTFSATLDSAIESIQMPGQPKAAALKLTLKSAG